METVAEHADHLVVSLDGLGDSFEEIRGISADRVIEYIRTLNEMRASRRRYDDHGSVNSVLKISLQMVLSKDNVDQIFRVMDTAVNLGVSQVILSHLLPSSVRERDKILYTLDENRELKTLFSRVQAYSLKKGLEVRLPARELKTERRCRFVEDDSTMINAEGEVVPCYRFAHECREFVFGREKQVAPHSFGNILEHPLREIWQSPAYRRYRFSVRNNRYPSCTDCDLVDGCDQVRSTEADCYGEAPSCADCLWARGIVYCV
jgi:radical SAM protein with 4Fe4S-binding SPASM domain